MKRLNKKGFTLVELLAVIVILALIMAIAIYSISGILQSSREGIFKDSALNVIKGVRTQLLALNAQEDGTYYFTSALLENDNDLPFGGKILYAPSATLSAATKLVSSSGDTPLYKASTKVTECTKTSTASYVNVTYSANSYTYSICLIPTGASASSGRYISGTEAALMGNTTTTIFSMAG